MESRVPFTHTPWSGSSLAAHQQTHVKMLLAEEGEASYPSIPLSPVFRLSPQGPILMLQHRPAPPVVAAPVDIVCNRTPS